MSEAAPATPPRRTIDALLSDRVSIADLAAELGVCERTIRGEMDRLQVPYVKLCNVRWYSRQDIRAALLARAVNRAPRGRGRPRALPQQQQHQN